MMQPLINISRRQALYFAFFLVSYEFIVYIANDMIMPGMLSVIRLFHAPETYIATSLTAYILGGSSLQLFIGPISDRYGRRPIMLLGGIWFAVFTLIIPMSQSITQFTLARFFQGMGLCYINVIGYALLQEIFDEKDAIRLVAVMANVAILSPLLGPLLGAEFLERGIGNWQAIFYWIGGFAVFTLWGLYRYMPESVGQKKRDGSVIKRESLAWSAIWNNYRALLKNRVFLFGAIAYGLMGVVCIVWIALSPTIVVNFFKYSLVQYGLWQFPVFVAYIIGNIILSILSPYYSAKQLSLLGCVLVLMGAIFLVVVPMLLGYSLPLLMIGFVIYSIGYGVAVTALNRFILFVAKVSAGTTSALISTSTMFFLTLGNELGNLIYAHYGLKVLVQYLCFTSLLYVMFALLSMYYHRQPMPNVGRAP